MQFEAQLTVKLTQTAGPTVTDPQHIANWLTLGWTDLQIDNIAMCSRCPDADSCDCGDDVPSSVFALTIETVNAIDQV